MSKAKKNLKKIKKIKNKINKCIYTHTHYQTLVPTTPKLTCLLLLLPKKQKKGKKKKIIYVYIYKTYIFRAVNKCQRGCRWVMRTAG